MGAPPGISVKKPIVSMGLAHSCGVNRVKNQRLAVRDMKLNGSEASFEAQTPGREKRRPEGRRFLLPLKVV